MEVRKCEHCGCEYEYKKYQGGLRFCSREHYYLHKRENTKMVSLDEQRAKWVEYNRLSRINNKQRHKDNAIAWLEKNWNRKLFWDARGRAKKHNKVFDITLEDIIIPEFCPILNIPLVIECGRGKQGDVPSLDRVDSTKGYIKDNVQVTSWRANNIKTDATLDELVMLGKWAEQQIAKRRLQDD